MLIFQLLDLERRLIWQKICFMKKCYFSLNEAPIWCTSCSKNLKCYLMLLQRVVFLKENFLAWICLRIFANLKHVKRLFQTRLDLSNCCLISFLEESPSKVARYKLLDWVCTFDMPKIRFLWKVLLLWSKLLRHNSAVLGQAALD